MCASDKAIERRKEKINKAIEQSSNKDLEEQLRKDRIYFYSICTQSNSKAKQFYQDYIHSKVKECLGGAL